MLLWKSIVSNKLLKKTNLVLFLNKTDILRAKLESGISFAQYIVSYGDRPNDYDNTSYCASLSPSSLLMCCSTGLRTSAGIRTQPADHRIPSPNQI